MARRIGFSLILVILTLSVWTISVLAGGVVVVMDTTSPSPISGTPFSVGFTIYSAHDGSLQSGTEPVVTASNPDTGEKISVTAQPEGSEGHYVATLTLPSAGEWNWEIQPFGPYAENYPATKLTPLEVQPGSTQLLAPSAPPAHSPVPTAVLVGMVLALAAVSSLMFVTRERQAA